MACNSGGRQIDPPGNLVAPPTIRGEICVDAQPTDAKITVNGTPARADGCAPVEAMEGQTVAVSVSAPGFVTHEQRVQVAPKVGIKVTLAAAPRDPPVGNLMPPPRPPPVGNLMPPPRPPPVDIVVAPPPVGNLVAPPRVDPPVTPEPTPAPKAEPPKPQ